MHPEALKKLTPTGNGEKGENNGCHTGTDDDSYITRTALLEGSIQKCLAHLPMKIVKRMESLSRKETPGAVGGVNRWVDAFEPIGSIFALELRRKTDE